jgi:lambda family phage portal protein
MLKEVTRARRRVKQNFIDKALAYIAPTRAAKRLRARLAIELFGSYDGASKSRRSLKEWNPLGYDADSDILPDLDTLRERSRDLVRNNPIAAGAIKTKVTNVIGTGFVFKSILDREALNLTDEQAEALESQIEREWRLFWGSKDLDVSRTCNGPDIARMVYQQSKENGEAFVLLPRVERKPGPYSLRLQVVEADRISNPGFMSDSEALAGGIERDAITGEPKAYHIAKQHPGRRFATVTDWERRPAFGENTGLRNVIHLYNPTRPGQSRGVPDLAPVIETLKQLGRYTEAEIMAAVISGMFTVFIESESGESTTGFDYSNLGDETGQQSSDKDVKLGNGLVVELAKGEKVHDSNPGRPNTAFDPFMLSIFRQIGAAIEIPVEILVKHFTASYSAARASLLALWQYVQAERRWFTDNFLLIVFEAWMWEAVALGRVAAPGFFSDPGVRAAYLGCKFIGTSKGQINEQAEVKAARERVDAGLSTLAAETAELTGGDWEQNHIQQVKERRRRLQDGLITLPPDPEDIEVEINE